MESILWQDIFKYIFLIFKKIITGNPGIKLRLTRKGAEYVKDIAVKVYRKIK